MHAIAANLPTCSWPTCSQPEVMTVKHRIPEETVRLAADGKRYLVRSAYTVEVGYCRTHGGEE